MPSQMSKIKASLALFLRGSGVIGLTSVLTAVERSCLLRRSTHSTQSLGVTAVVCVALVRGSFLSRIESWKSQPV